MVPLCAASRTATKLPSRSKIMTDPSDVPMPKKCGVASNAVIVSLLRSSLVAEHVATRKAASPMRRS